MKNKNKNILILFISVLSLQSCFVTKEYQRSEVDTNNLYREISVYDSSRLAKMPWQDLFVDKNLQSLINSALINNLDLLIAVERVSASEVYLKQAKLAFLPSVNLGASGGVTNSSDNSSLRGVNVENYQLNANISWEADIWGKIKSQKKSTLAAYLKTESSRRVVESKLISKVASSYYMLLSLDAQLDLAKETVNNRTESLLTMKSLKQAGRVSESAVKQTEAQLYSTEILFLDIKEKIKLQENNISILLGEASSSILRSKLKDQRIDVDMKTGFASELLSNRPDVMMAEYELIESFELVNVARSEFYPSLKLGATFGFESMSFDNWFSTASIFNNVIGNITQPLFNKRKLKSQYEIAQMKKKESLLRFKKSLLIAGKEVSDVLYEYKSEEDKFQYRKKESKALNEAVVISEELLNRGYGNTTYLEVLTSKNNALSSELNLINSKYRQLNSVVKLYLALGGGWLR